jgi:hypothetical protein
MFTGNCLAGSTGGDAIMLYGLSLPAFLVESRRRIARRATTAPAAMHKLVALSVTAAAKGLDSVATED